MNQGQISLDGTTEEVFSHKDLLRECHISLPQVADLSYRLGDCGIPENVIRVSDMVQLLKGGRS